MYTNSNGLSINLSSILRLLVMYKHSCVASSVILRDNIYLLKTAIRLLFQMSAIPQIQYSKATCTTDDR